MSSLPWISHRLFVAAVGHDRGKHPKPSQNQSVENSDDHEIRSRGILTEEFDSYATHQFKGSVLARQT